MIVSIIALAALAIFAFYAAGKVLPRMGDSMLKFKFEEMKQRGGAWKLFALFAEGNDDEVNTMRKLFSGKGVKWLAVTLGIVFVAGWLVTGCNGSLPTPGTPDEPESEALQKDDDWTPPECGEAYGYTGPLRNIEPCAEPVPVDPSPRYLDPENPADPTWKDPTPRRDPLRPSRPNRPLRFLPISTSTSAASCRARSSRQRPRVSRMAGISFGRRSVSSSARVWSSVPSTYRQT